MFFYDYYFLILGREIELFEMRFLENWFTKNAGDPGVLIL